MNGFTDKPTSTLNEDAFGVQQYIAGLNEFIMECYTPMTIAIQGDWGSGKTSMMNMIREQLGERVITTWFNTWQYSQFNMGDALAISFLSRLIADLETEQNTKTTSIKNALRTISRFAKTASVIAADTFVVTIFKAARRSNRILIQDLYMAEIASAAGKTIPNARTFSGVRVFITNGWNGRHELLDSKYHKTKIGRSGIAKQKFVMCVRPSMQDYLDTLSNEISFHHGILFYSMWDGYKAKADVAEFLQFMQDKGVRIVDLHTSGHADAETIHQLICDIAPKYIIPVHTENADWFHPCEGRTVIFDQSFQV